VLLSLAFSCFYEDVKGTILLPPSFIPLPHMWALTLLAHLAAEAFSIWTGCSDARHQLNPSRFPSNFPAYWPLNLSHLMQGFELNCSKITKHWQK